MIPRDAIFLTIEGQIVVKPLIAHPLGNFDLVQSGSIPLILITAAASVVRR